MRWINLFGLVGGRILLGETEIASFNVLQVSPPDFKEAQHQILAPALDPFTCNFDLDSLPDRNQEANYTALAIIPTPFCHDYLYPIKSFSKTYRNLVRLGFPPISSVLFCNVDGARVPAGSPDSTIYAPSAEFIPMLNISYHVVSDFQLAKLLSSSPNLVGKIINEQDPWTRLLNSSAQFAWTVAFRVLKFLLLMVQFILCGFVCARTKFRGRLQIFLLVVGIFQLGGEQVLSWMAADALAVRLYSSSMLLPACIVNSMVVISWCNIVWRLKTSVVIGPFKVGAVFESVTLSLSIILQLFLVVCADRWVGNNTTWFAGFRLLVLLMMSVFPTLMGVWFFRTAQNFCPIFHATAKLINAQWFTMFILLTRAFFIINLMSYFLIMLWVDTPAKYIAFNTMNAVSTVAYNVMIVLTVLKMQAITPIQHRWTPEQLGLNTLPDGTVVCQFPDDSQTSSQTSSQQSAPTHYKPNIGAAARSNHLLLPNSLPKYPPTASHVILDPISPSTSFSPTLNNRNSTQSPFDLPSSSITTFPPLPNTSWKSPN